MSLEHLAGRLAEVLDELARDGRVGRAVEEMTDAEVAVVIDRWREQAEGLTHVVLSEVVGRLRRAGGGPYRSCSWCPGEAGIEVNEGSDAGQWWCGECDRNTSIEGARNAR